MAQLAGITDLLLSTVTKCRHVSFCHVTGSASSAIIFEEKHFASSYRWIELLPSQGGRGNTIPGFWLPQVCAGTCGKAFSPGRLAAYTTSSSSNLQAVRKIHHMKAATAVQPLINYPQVNRLNLIEQITTAAGRLAPSPSSPCTVGILDEGC